MLFNLIIIDLFNLNFLCSGCAGIHPCNILLFFDIRITQTYIISRYISIYYYFARVKSALNKYRIINFHIIYTQRL